VTVQLIASYSKDKKEDDWSSTLHSPPSPGRNGKPWMRSPSPKG
jgi:hypothetical protein